MSELFEILRGWGAYALMSMSLEFVGSVLSLVLLAVVAIGLWRSHNNSTSPIDLRDIFVDETGKLGSSKMRLNGAWILFSWVIVFITLRGTLTEWLVAIYIAAFVYDRANSRKTETPKTAIKAEIQGDA